MYVVKLVVRSHARNFLWLSQKVEGWLTHLQYTHHLQTFRLYMPRKLSKLILPDTRKPLVSTQIVFCS